MASHGPVFVAAMAAIWLAAAGHGMVLFGVASLAAATALLTAQAIALVAFAALG